MKNRYETVFISTPVLSEVQVKEAVDKFKDIITSNEGSIINDEYWGLKPLAYPIKNTKSGFYQLLEFEAPAVLIDKLEIELRRDERILRFLSVKLDKYAAEFSEKRRTNRKAAAENTNPTEKKED